MVACQPFENTFDTGELQGLYVKQFLEDSDSYSVGLMQLAGMFSYVFERSLTMTY